MLTDFPRKDLERQHTKSLEQSKASSAKTLQDRTAARDKLEQGTEEWRTAQQLVDDTHKGVLSDELEIDNTYTKYCRDVNARADRETKVSLSSRINPATRKPTVSVQVPLALTATSIDKPDQLTSETEQRRQSLQLEMEHNVLAIQSATRAEQNKLDAERDVALQNFTMADNGYHKITNEYSARHEMVEVRERAQLLEVQESGTSLASQHKRHTDEDARFVPVGKTNLYARTFETFGEPTGNQLPLIAESQMLKLTPSKLKKAP